MSDANAPSTTEKTKETIVIAEDSAPNRKILMHLLVKLGYEVVAFENGGDAWKAIQEKKVENVVAIISDIMMPNMDGIQLLRNVRGHADLAKVPFVLVTAVSDKEYIVQAKDLNVNGYILKPVTFQRVTGKLQELFPTRNFPKLAG
jgi:two-component system chemotaxis response regulator CheY